MKRAVLLFAVMVLGLVALSQSARTENQNSDIKGNPDVFVLYQNYPNPFNPSTVLSYNLKTDAAVKLTIYNLVGQVVQVVVDEYQTAGYKEFTFDAQNLPAGIYLYKLQVGEYSSVKRMTLVK